METTSVFSTVLIGLGIFLLARFLLYRFLFGYMQKKLLTDDYVRVLNSTEFQVKGKYE